MADYLHNHKDFEALFRIVADDKKILPGLIEKDYWIMHSLFGLQQNGFEFELKGGTSLSKAYGIIHRFSEDIDLHIKPKPDLKINENPKNTKHRAVEGRKFYYDWLASNIHIDGITSVERDKAFDDERAYRSGGIRLNYQSFSEPIDGVKEGILLEAGFAKVTPNNKVSISSWAFEEAVHRGVEIIDNRAVDVACYHPGYTFVEKLQTIITKFRVEQTEKKELPNLMRQYYDVASLLANDQVAKFIGSEEYEAHKLDHFGKADLEISIAENQAFLLEDKDLHKRFVQRYEATGALYYQGQPSFSSLLQTINEWLPKL